MVNLFQCKHCKTGFRVTFWRKHFPYRCPSCGKFTKFKPVKENKSKSIVVKREPVAVKRPLLWRCLDCGHRFYSVDRIVCPRCHNQGERDRPVKQWRFPMNIFFRSR